MGRFNCPKCTRFFVTYDCMMRHARGHCDTTDAKFRCTFCNYGSKYSSNVYKHYRRVHKNANNPVFRPDKVYQ